MHPARAHTVCRPATAISLCCAYPSIHSFHLVLIHPPSTTHPTSGTHKHLEQVARTPSTAHTLHKKLGIRPRVVGANNETPLPPTATQPSLLRPTMPSVIDPHYLWAAGHLTVLFNSGALAIHRQQWGAGGQVASVASKWPVAGWMSNAQAHGRKAQSTHLLPAAAHSTLTPLPQCPHQTRPLTPSRSICDPPDAAVPRYPRQVLSPGVHWCPPVVLDCRVQEPRQAERRCLAPSRVCR